MLAVFSDVSFWTGIAVAFLSGILVLAIAAAQTRFSDRAQKNRAVATWTPHIRELLAQLDAVMGEIKPSSVRLETLTHQAHRGAPNTLFKWDDGLVVSLMPNQNITIKETDREEIIFSFHSRVLSSKHFGRMLLDALVRNGHEFTPELSIQLQKIANPKVR
ncbi:MAG: hypothetical protein ACHQUB_00455 [Candidatus Saccharimonadia bacterium]